MTATLIRPAPVRRSVFVNASPQHAFEVFTAGFGRWWPKTHSVGSAPQTDAVLELREGGRWYEVGEDGSQCDWGRVAVFEPPHRMVLIWSIGADWKYDPNLETEVEVTFTPEGSGVRVDLEHRNLERMGEAAEAVAAQVGAEGGWGGLLKIFAEVAEA
jgi:uncharacterized protein YndB with AHSA1/START domain